MPFPTKGQAGAGGSPWALLPLRLYLGVALLLSGVDKLRLGARWAGTMTDQLQKWRPESYDFYRTLLDQNIIPHKALIASLVCWGETLVGVALILGLLTRFASLAGLAIMLNILLARGEPIWSATTETAFLFGLVALMLTGAGRIYGLDARLASKWPRLPLW